VIFLAEVMLRRLNPRAITQALIDSVNLDELSDLTTSSDSDTPLFPPPLLFRHHRPNGIEYEIGNISPTRENPNPIEDLTSSDDEVKFDTFKFQSKIQFCFISARK
jgi:hypothetical protein